MRQARKFFWHSVFKLITIKEKRQSLSGKGEYSLQIAALHIRNFRYIHDLKIENIENSLILVGTNSSGKTGILQAIRCAMGDYQVREEDFNEKKQNIEIEVKLLLSQEDIRILHENGIISRYKNYEAWQKAFCSRLPSFKEGTLHFTYIANQKGTVRYADGIQKHNKYIPQILPKIYFIDTQRDLKQMQEDILMFQEDDLLKQMRSGCCLFNRSRQCSHCFSCIGLLYQKKPEELNAFETARLLEYKLYQMNLNDFSEKVNKIFHRNGGDKEEIRFDMICTAESLFQVRAAIFNQARQTSGPVETMGKGMRSIYMLSLLEAYVEEAGRSASLIMMEDPEIFLHPKLQKISGEILYRLSKKNQVIFSTHSPNLLVNFNSRQIRQTYRDDKYYTCMKEQTDIDAILDELGYTANDLMNVNFVFIVEGKQDKSRLPLLLKKYYTELYDKQGRLSRIAIITTNSCTNIKTYANLKYMNKIYLRDQFLMIRDSDGQKPEELARQLCLYYDERNLVDVDKLPRVTRRNVLILKYYSFENYFLNPEVMKQIGIVKEEEDFYTLLWKKWKEYLCRIKSGRHFTEVLGRELRDKQDLKEHMELFKIYMRGHNLYDIFYAPFREQENSLLEQYIELAPKEDFADILESIDKFIYFDSRRV